MGFGLVEGSSLIRCSLIGRAPFERAPAPVPLEGDLQPTSGFRPILVIADFSPRVPSVGPSSPWAARAIAPRAAMSRLER